ncbi:glycoside hydrolase family 55 protein [Meiothermus hypogaeus]|nr:glycoside hydrolase family 55 protein [Meiothermus hypogaeus]
MLNSLRYVLLVMLAVAALLGGCAQTKPGTPPPPPGTPPPPAAGWGEEFSGPYPSWKSVKDYGAKGDGVSDDTAAIQRALDDLKTVKDNPWSVLYFPAGRYRITATLSTQRNVHDDYLGAQIVGEHPENTLLVWDGPSGGTMMRWDAWYDKLSRLTFDGQGRAANGLVRAGGFATYGELSDLIFRDISGTCLNFGNGEVNGVAEQAVLRSRFYRCDIGLATQNYNSLDIYAWYNYFEDNTTAMFNAAGAFHVYENRFVRSKEADLRSGVNMVSSLVNNLSVGSKAFIRGFLANVYLQGNRVYATTGTPLDLTNADPVVLVDNMVQAPAGQPAVRLPGANALLIGNTFSGPTYWPVRVPEQPFNHGFGTIAQPIELAVDGNPSTYTTLGMWRYEAGIQWNTPPGTRRTAVRYALSSAQGLPDARPDPQDFALFGSNDWGSSWVRLDLRTGERFSPGQRKEYVLASPQAFALYELRVLKNALGQVPGQEPGGWVSLAEFELLDNTGKRITAEVGGLVQGADEDWGRLYADPNSMTPQSISSPPEVKPWDFVPRKDRPRISVTAFTGEAVQQAINQAATLPVGSRPVVHLPKGRYRVSNTITVPAGVELSLVGDGAGYRGSSLAWEGAGSGPVLRLAGPSRATLRDLEVMGGSMNGADALVIEGADGPGGRVYGSQVLSNGPGSPNNAALAFEVLDLRQTEVTMTAFGMSSFLGGVRVIGGGGRVDFLTGASSQGSSLFEVRQGGRLVVTGMWYEGNPTIMAPLIDLGAQSGGRLALGSLMLSVILPGQPLVRTSDYAGSLSIISSQLDHRDSSRLEFAGDGRNTQVLGAGNHYPLFTDPAPNKPVDQLWRDTTAPAGQVSQVVSDYPALTNKVVGAQPDLEFVKAQLEPLRTVNTSPALNRPAGVTDVKLLRVVLNASNGRTGLRVRGN